MFPDDAVGAITALVAAVDRILALDPDTLTDDQLGGAVVELHRQTARLAAGRAHTVAAFEARGGWAADGSSTAAAWMARHCRLPDDEAKAEVRLAQRLRSMPVIDQALSAGEIGVAHARRLSGLNQPRLAPEFAEAEQNLVDEAHTSSWPDFQRITAYWRHLAEPDKTERKAANVEAERRVHLSPAWTAPGSSTGNSPPPVVRRSGRRWSGSNRNCSKPTGATPATASATPPPSAISPAAQLNGATSPGRSREA